MRTFFIFGFFLGLLSLAALGAESFSFQTDSDFGFKLTVSTNKKDAFAQVKEVFRDREGDSFALVYTHGAYPVFGGKLSKNLPAIHPQDNLYTIVRISPEGRPIWTLHLNNKKNSSFTLNHFSVSPQGNVAIGINFKGHLSFSQASKEFNSMKTDQVFLFLRKSNGGLLKDLHFSGAGDEFGGEIIWGTGGELLVHLKSNSNKVVYDHGHYNFSLKSTPDKPITKDLFLTLKKSFYPKWKRSVEPSGITSISFYDKEKVFVGFNHGAESQGLFRSGTSVKIYNKPKKTPMRAVGLSLNSSGKLEWDIILKDRMSSASILKTKVFHDGGVGTLVQMGGRRLTLSGSGGASKSFSHIGKDSSKQLFIKIDSEGSLEKSAKIYGTSGVQLIPTSSTDNLFIHKTKKNSKKKYKNLDGSSGVLSKCKKDNYQHLFVVNEDFDYAYSLSRQDCERIYPLEVADFRLASGHIETLRVDKNQNIELFKVPYREEVLDDETIPGLAYTPNFINDHPGEGKKVDYNYSYAIPAHVNGVMVYFISEGRDHLDALRDPMLQASLNAAYFRNYVPITVWTSDSEIIGKRLESLFDKLLSKEILKLDWPWYFNAFGTRATQINSLYKSKNTNSIGKLNPELLILWNLEDIPEGKNDRTRLTQQVTRSRESLFISSYANKEGIEKTKELYLEFDRQRRRASHIITEPIKIYSKTFSSIPGIPNAIGESFFKELKERECIDKNHSFTKSPYHKGFKTACIDSMTSLKGLSDSVKERILWFSKEVYSPSDFSPFYDKEIYNFIEQNR